MLAAFVVVDQSAVVADLESLVGDGTPEAAAIEPRSAVVGP